MLHHSLSDYLNNEDIHFIQIFFLRFFKAKYDGPFDEQTTQFNLCKIT